MSNMVKTYFLSPTWDCPPDNPRFIALGNIISSPSTVTRPLLPVDPDSRPVPDKLPSKYHGDWSNNDARSGKVGIYTKFVQYILGLGVDAAVTLEKQETLDLSYETLTTQEFSPPIEYIVERINRPEVLAFLNRPMTARKAIYMVVGVKHVYGASVKRSVRKAREISLDAGVDATSTTMVPVSGGVVLQPKRRRTEAASWAASDDFVFAYKLIRIEVKRGKRPPKVTDYTSGTMLGGSGIISKRDAENTLDVTSVKAAGVEAVENGERLIVALSDDWKDD